jgi:ACS family hexuronate transporter-like MFS transporter
MPLSRGRAWLVAAVATLAMTVSYVDRQVVAAIGASVRKALSIDAQHFGWLAAAFSLSYLVAAPLAGVVVDRVGARRGLIGGIVVWSVVSAAHALAPTFAALFVLRILLGAAEAPSFPAAAQSVRRALPVRDRSAAFGLIFTGSSLGAAIAAPLAITLDVRFGWRTAFVVASVVGMIWLPLWIVVTGPAPVRAALAVAEPPDVAPSARADGPRPLGVRAIARALVLVCASAPGLMMMYVWMPQYFELGRGVPKAALPHYLWLPPLMGDVGMVGFGALAGLLDRRSTEKRSRFELVLVAAVLESMLAFVPSCTGTWSAVAVMGIGAAGGGGLYTLLTADMMARVDPRRVSLAGGLTAAAQSLAYVVLNPLVGHWIDVSHSFDGSIVLLGVVALPGAVAWCLWPMKSSA